MSLVKADMFASSLGVVFNSHDSRYVPFHKWLEENIIDVHEIWCDRNKKCFEGTDVDVAATVQKAQRSTVNFKNASTVLWRH